MTFPLIGSAVLLGLFLLFKFLPQDLINTVLTGYFVLIGIVAVTVTISPFVGLAFSSAAQKKSYKLPQFRIPYLFKAINSSWKTKPCIVLLLHLACLLKLSFSLGLCRLKQNNPVLASVCMLPKELFSRGTIALGDFVPQT